MVNSIEHNGLVSIVGPCSAGKSTLAKQLRELGYRVKEVRQEHSMIPDLWRKFNPPDVLIYVDVAMDEAARREGLDKPSSWWVEEREVRLTHARAHSDIYVDTTHLTPTQVFEEVLSWLHQ